MFGKHDIRCHDIVNKGILLFCSSNIWFYWEKHTSLRLIYWHWTNLVARLYSFLISWKEKIERSLMQPNQSRRRDGLLLCFSFQQFEYNSADFFFFPQYVWLSSSCLICKLMVFHCQLLGVFAYHCCSFWGFFNVKCLTWLIQRSSLRCQTHACGIIIMLRTYLCVSGVVVSPWRSHPLQAGQRWRRRKAWLR